MEKIVVLGTGMAGFGATTFLQSEDIRPVVFDKNAYFGGHTASFQNPEGFVFDLGPHISFTKDERIQTLFADYVNQDYESLQVKLSNYWQGYTLTHPVQLHLNGLPNDLIVEIVCDFVEQQKSEDTPINNYEDWLIQSYGRKFAETFPMQYTRKYHTTSADNMTVDWLGPRMYQPTLQELLTGALAPWTPDVHYVSHFRYPIRGGFVSYQSQFPSIANLRLNHALVGIDPKEKSLIFSNGKASGYRTLISSIALPDLIPMISGVPEDVAIAARNLACSTCVLVNLGVNRADLSESHMTYFYDEDICFTRLSFPHMLSANNAPPEHGSIQAEIYFSEKYRPLSVAPDSLIQPAIHDLIRCGILTAEDSILSQETHLIKYANVIFDSDRQAALETVHGFLNDIGIHYCGRYGDWGYMWTDESFMSGEEAASRALKEA